jgi:hypothetical protein
MTIDALTQRVRQCACGVRFLTTEKITKKLPPVTPVAASQPPSDADAAQATPSRPPAHISSPQDSRSLSALPSENQSQTRSRVKRRTEIIYPEGFEAEWRQTAKTGSKDKALALWLELGTPMFGESWKRWEMCDEWRQPWFNRPHVRSWLSDGRWKQEPPESRVRQMGSTLPLKVEQSRATAVAWAHKVTG